MKTRKIFLRVLLCLGFMAFQTPLPALPAQEYRSPATATASPQEKYEQGLSLLRAGQAREAIPLLEEALKFIQDNPYLKADYLLALVFAGDYDRAIRYYRQHATELAAVRYVPRNIAKAFYETRDFAQARIFYEKAFALDPADGEAYKGLVFSCCRLRDFYGAYQVWAQARRQGLIPAKALAEGELYILHSLGASSRAYRVAVSHELSDPVPRTVLQNDMAVDRLKWDEFSLAAAMLERILDLEPDNWRARGDYIVALRSLNEMNQVVFQYEIMAQTGRPLPYWVTEAVADAYLYLKKPELAVKFYNRTLEKPPDDPFNTYMGLYYSYVELRQWDQARQMLDKINEITSEARNPILEKKRNVSQFNAAITTRGWFLLYQDRLREGQDYFKEHLRQAGLNPSLRTGLAHAYLWDYKPRLAREQFQIVTNTHPEEKSAKIGLAWTLNELNYRREARALAQQLYWQAPDNRHVQNLYETLQVEDRPDFSSDMNFIKEFQGATEYFIVSTLTVPYNPLFKVYGQIIRQATRYQPPGDPVLDYSWDRAALGFEWVVVPQLTWRQAVSLDYLNGKDVASYTRLQWRPNDPLRITGEFNSFGLNVPIRARARGVTAKNAVLDFTYLESHSREYAMAVGLNMFSDSNYNPFVIARADQLVLNYPDFKVRLGLTFDYFRYTKQDVDYFSPLHDYTIMFTPTIHWTHYARYDRRWRSSFYPRAGVNKQVSYDFLPVAGITYEQYISFSQQCPVKFLHICFLTAHVHR